MRTKGNLLLGVSLFLNATFILIILWLWNGARGNTLPDSAPPPATVLAAVTLTDALTDVLPTATPTPKLDPSPTPAPTETATPTATAPPPTPTPTAPPPPTETPPPEDLSPPAESNPLFTGPLWLRYLNYIRFQAGLPLLSENVAWSSGSAAHSRYMALHDLATHSQDPRLEGYSEAGAMAAANGNIAMSGSADVSLVWPIDYWMSASFHALPILDPQLQWVGYGDYRDASRPSGMTATLDVKRGLAAAPLEGVKYPITFPRHGGQIWVTSFRLPEFPDTVASCPGYTRPTGAPLIVQLGPGDLKPSVIRTELLLDGQPIPHCAFDETNYQNSNPYWQTVGRQILRERDAVVLLPRSPLVAGGLYQATVEANGQVISWEFTVVAPPRLDE